MPSFNFSLDARLSQAVYSSNNQPNTAVIDGWKPIRLDMQGYEPSATFGAQLYQNNGQYKVVFRGTETNLNDWIVNFQYGLRAESPEFKDTAVFMARAVAFVAKEEGVPIKTAVNLITTTGHSQGGFESQLASLLYGTKGTSLDGMGAVGVAQQFRGQLNQTMQENGMGELIADRTLGTNDFVTRVYTQVGNLGVQAGSVDGAYSWSLIKLAFIITRSARGAVVASVLGLSAHLIDGIVANELKRDRSPVWRLLGDANNSDDFNPSAVQVAEDAAFHWSSVLTASLGGGALPLDASAIKALTTTFLQAHAGQEYDIAYEGNNYVIKIKGGDELRVNSNGSAQSVSTVGTSTVIKEYATGTVLSTVSTLQPLTDGKFEVTQVTSSFRSVSIVESSGELLSLDRTDLDAQQNPVGRSVFTRNSDATTTVVKFDEHNNLLTTTQTQTFDDGTRLEEVTSLVNGHLTTLLNAYGIEGNLLSSHSVDVSPALTSLINPPLTGQQTTTALNDVAALISAIQSGQPLPILNSGLRLANSLTANTPNQSLVGAGQLVGGLASLYSLSNALQHGDTLTQLNASLATLNYVNNTLPSLLNGSASSPLSAGLDTLLNGQTVQITNTAGELVNAQGLLNGAAPGVLPVIGLIVSIRSGDPIGITSGLIGIINPALLSTPVGWILAGASILRALNSTPPEAWGIGKFILDANGQLQIDTVGESFGTERVATELHTTRSYLNAMIAQANSGNSEINSNTALGIIAQRTASLTWREARQTDAGYAINDIDPISGQQRYPYLRWDDTGTPFSSNPQVWQPDPTDPGIRPAMREQLIASALRRQAIAPLWEVNTARMQQDAGDALAGLTETERAARMGLGATYTASTGTGTGTAQPIGQFRPVTLDLSGDGTISTIAKDDPANPVGFNWDDSGFIKQVAWVQPSDGFLFLDRDLNGVVTSGNELFSNSLVSDDYKGVRSLEAVDANRDGVINALDPVYAHLRVWQDSNQDGDSHRVLADGSSGTASTSTVASSLAQDPNELRTLAELGITELDYTQARFTRNSTQYALRSDELAADANGTQITQLSNGIAIDYSNGTSQFVITQVTSLAGGADRIEGLFEDGDPTGNPRATPMEIAIPVSLLLGNAANAAMWRQIA